MDNVARFVRTAAAATAALGAGCILAVPAAHAQVLFSDNFNSDAQAGSTTTLPGWNVTAGNVDIIGTGFFDFYPGNGNYLDMSGTTGASITTQSSFSLTPGSYTLSFDLGKNGSSPETMTVSVGSALSHVVSDAPTGGSYPNFIPTSFNFTVGSTTTAPITFDNSGDPDVAGWVIDNVVLTKATSAAAPEPGSIALAATGLLPLLGSALARRRRKGI